MDSKATPLSHSYELLVISVESWVGFVLTRDLGEGGRSVCLGMLRILSEEYREI